ncbi:hypothetical protein ACLOJK_036520 [Asimina triloba]
MAAIEIEEEVGGPPIQAKLLLDLMALLDDGDSLKLPPTYLLAGSKGGALPMLLVDACWSWIGGLPVMVSMDGSLRKMEHHIMLLRWSTVISAPTMITTSLLAVFVHRVLLKHSFHCCRLLMEDDMLNGYRLGFGEKLCISSRYRRSDDVNGECRLGMDLGLLLFGCLPPEDAIVGLVFSLSGRLLKKMKPRICINGMGTPWCQAAEERCWRCHPSAHCGPPNWVFPSVDVVDGGWP